MTNHWNDIQYSDCILIMGSNPAENHPISFRWILKAQEKGGKIVSVDPRFTRSSAKADIFAPLRSGTDIAFIGGLINYAIENKLYHKEYIVKYTNAAYILDDAYDFHDGLFSGFDEAGRKYDQAAWGFKKDAAGNVLTDETLEDPRCVFQIMKKHYSRYDIDTVISVTGTPKENFLEVAKAFCGTGKAGKTGTIMYAMGGTQSTHGSQNVRAYAVIQLLLGNIGLPGGGVNALRGESNVQGSTDFGLLYHNITGYLNTPADNEKMATLQAYLDSETPKSGYYVNKPKFFVSYLKAMYGEKATAINEFGYQYHPKLKSGKNNSYMGLFDEMYEGNLKGLFLFGQNPVVGSPNSGKSHNALAKLDWMVTIDLFETETSVFWKKEAGKNPAEINTEVFFLPACGSYEKEGTVTNSGRWMQYRWQAIQPKGDSKGDLEIIHVLARKLKELYKNDSSPVAEPFNALSWNFGEHDHPDIDLIQREINGFDSKTGKLIPGFGKLMDDGSTVCGNWIYCGFYPDEGKNLSKARDNKDTGMNNFLNWSFAWPMNRRILYNRCSTDYNGKPWSDDKKVIWWDQAKKEWTGYDVPDFTKTQIPTEEAGLKPFIMNASGVGNLFANLKDGPLPEHYEPYESPIPNPFSSIEVSPVAAMFSKKSNKKGNPKDFPIVATTYRVSEHWQSGSMTRNQPFLAELMPHMFVEISEELAKEKGINNKDRVIIKSARAEIEVYALVTKRFKPFKIKGKKVHHIGMPWNYGFNGIATGASANDLTIYVGDANSQIPEYKAFLCDIRRA